MALALIAVLLAASDSAQEVAIKLVLCVVTATVAVALALRMLRTCRVEASPGWIRYTRATGKQVLVDLTSARGILGKQARTRIDLLVVVSAEGKRLFHMSTDLWRPQDLRTITRLGGFVVDPDVHRIEDWETRLPGSTRLVDRHPYALGVVLAIIIVAAAVLIAVTML